VLLILWMRKQFAVIFLRQTVVFLLKRSYNIAITFIWKVMYDAETI